MAKSKYFWYSFVAAGIRRYKINDPAPFAQRMREAVEKALAQTAELPDGSGPDRILAVELVLMNQTHNFEGAGLVLDVSAHTVQRYVATFVYLTAAYAGFPPFVPAGSPAADYLTPSQRTSWSMSAVTPACRVNGDGSQ